MSRRRPMPHPTSSRWQVQRGDLLRAYEDWFPHDMEPYGDPPDELGRGGDPERLRDYKAVFIHNNAQTAQVRRVLWDLLNVTGINRNCFAPNPQEMAFNAGVQFVGQHLLGVLLDEAVETVIEEKPND